MTANASEILRVSDTLGRGSGCRGRGRDASMPDWLLLGQSNNILQSERGWLF